MAATPFTAQINQYLSNYNNSILDFLGAAASAMGTSSAEKRQQQKYPF